MKRVVNNFFLIFLTTLVYGFIYSRMGPEDFDFKSPLDPYYFATTTMSSVGFGDIVPKSDRAKMLVMSQQVIILSEVWYFILLSKVKWV
jgi:voltage-gated potassium channel